MARIPLVDPNAGDGDAQEVLRGIGGGLYPNVYRAIANHPKALEAFAALGNLVYFESALTPAQRELAYLTASVVNDCHY